MTPHPANQERISLCADIAHEKKNYGFTPDLDFNPVFTEFNFTEFLLTSIHRGKYPALQGKKNW